MAVHMYLRTNMSWVHVCRLVLEECYPWEGRMAECAVPKKKKELNATCPRSFRSRSDRMTKTQLRRVGPVYRVATEEGIMYEIMTSGSVQGMLYKCFRKICFVFIIL